MSSAIVTFIGLVLIGLTLIVLGVCILAGAGWGILSAGFACFFCAAVVRLGMVAKTNETK